MLRHMENSYDLATGSVSADKGFLKIKKAALFFEIFKKLPDAVFVVNRNFFIVEVNDKGSIVFGIDRTELIEKNFGEILAVDATLLQVSGSYECEKDGKTYSVTCEKIFLQDWDGFIVILKDITALFAMKKTIQELEETSKDMDAVFRFSHDGICVCDGMGVAKKHNEAYDRITGINSAELVGMDMNQMIGRGYISESATLLALQTRKTATTMPKLKSGNKALITANPVFDENGNIIRIIANVRDVTELITLKSELEEVRKLSQRYYSEVLHLRNQHPNVSGVITESNLMKAIVSTALTVAPTDATVTITGDSGVGKEVLARIIHNNSERRNEPFVKINCGAIPETLVESELFGYEKGAFTNAARAGKPGLFEISQGGTLFLDEIGEIPFNLQSKLLGVLQDMKFTRVGGTKEVMLKARLIAATNRDLLMMVREGTFRKDLFYRINIVALKIPSLAERKDDIFPLANHFLQKFNHKYKTSNTISPQVMNALINYDWPGNVREVENLIERLVVLAPNQQIVTEMLPDALWDRLMLPSSRGTRDTKLKEISANIERLIIKDLLGKGYSSYKIAAELGVNQSTIIRKIKKLGIKEQSAQYGK